MKVVDVDLKDRSEDLVEKLLVVWESSVRATHLFLSDNEISEIKKYVPQALKEIPRLILLKNDRNTLVGFMGLVDSHLLNLRKEVRDLVGNFSSMGLLNTPLMILL